MAGYIGSKASVVSSGAERKTTITATSGQTSLTGLSYTPNKVHVFQNGVRLVDGTDYTATNGSTITLTVGASADDQIVVISYATFETSDTVSASAGGTFSNAVTIDADGSTVLTVDRATSDGMIIDVQKSGSSVGSIVSTGGDFIISGTASSVKSGIRFDNSTITPALNGADVDASVDLGYSARRFKDLYLSGGIHLGGTGSANYLDDVETGTWTPTSSVNGFTVSLGNFNAARYVKIGKIVHVTFDMVFGSAAYGSGYSHVGGLPFASTATAVNGWYSSGSISGNSAGGPIFVGSGTSSIYLFQGINNNTATTWNVGFTYETA